MFCSVNDNACFEISVPGLGIEAIDLAAASKNMPNACSAWSMVFSARSRNSAGTSNFGSAMVVLPVWRDVSIFPGAVCAVLKAQYRFGRRRSTEIGGETADQALKCQPPDICVAI